MICSHIPNANHIQMSSVVRRKEKQQTITTIKYSLIDKQNKKWFELLFKIIETKYWFKLGGEPHAINLYIYCNTCIQNKYKYKHKTINN